MSKLIKETCSYRMKPAPIRIYHVVDEGADDNALMNWCPIERKMVKHYVECHQCQYLGEGGD